MAIILAIVLVWLLTLHAPLNSKVPQQVCGSASASQLPAAALNFLYLTGPAHVAKRDVKHWRTDCDAGEKSGRRKYVALLGKGEGAARAVFYVAADKPANINFLARPRECSSETGAISGVAFVFDQFNNAVLAPTPVKFNLSVEGGAPVRVQ